MVSNPYHRTMFLLHFVSLENVSWKKGPQFPSTEGSYKFGKGINMYTDNS